jgi:hypothetical protein
MNCRRVSRRLFTRRSGTRNPHALPWRRQEWVLYLSWYWFVSRAYHGRAPPALRRSNGDFFRAAAPRRGWGTVKFSQLLGVSMVVWLWSSIAAHDVLGTPIARKARKAIIHRRRLRRIASLVAARRRTPMLAAQQNPTTQQPRCLKIAGPMRWEPGEAWTAARFISQASLALAAEGLSDVGYPRVLSILEMLEDYGCVNEVHMLEPCSI